MDTKRLRVLVIDQNETWRRALLRGLPAHGFSVLLAATLSEGRDLLQREDASAIVLDLLLPEGNGLRFLPELRSIRPEAAFLICTAHGSIAAAVAAMRVGADDFLLKPTTAAHVSVSIRRALDSTDPGRPADSIAVPAAPMPLDRIHWEHLQRVLMECEWNISEAARRLGIHRQSLQRKLRRCPALREHGPGARG